MNANGTLTKTERKHLDKIGQGLAFTAEVRRLDLEYDGQFETVFCRSGAMSLGCQAETILQAIANQLDVDDCEYDEDTLSSVFYSIIDELQLWGGTGKREAVSQFAVFFTERNGCEGQYYIFLQGKEPA